MSSLVEIQEQLNQYKGLYDEYFSLRVGHHKGKWHATVGSMKDYLYSTCHGSVYSAIADTPEEAAQKATDKALEQAPADAWKFQPIRRKNEQK